jgi:glycogen phosphorylase
VFDVATPSRLPDSGVEDQRIRRLVQLAYNLRWTWEPRTKAVFQALEPEVWRTSHNPVAVLRAVHTQGAHALRQQTSAIDTACDDLERYLHPSVGMAAASYPRIAYLSADFSCTSPAADHLKAASDLGLPVIGLGLLPAAIHPERLALRPVLTSDRTSLQVAVPWTGGDRHARVWWAEVGRTRLYLLDPNNGEHDDEERFHLYRDVVLGVGGARLLSILHATGQETDFTGYHLNGSHAAMCIPELARQRCTAQSTTTFEQALKHVSRAVACTSDSGHPDFSTLLVQEYLSGYRHELRLSATEFNALGQMEALARQGSAHYLDSHDIASGVHAPTWVGPEMATLFDSWLGRVWRFSARRPATWAALYDVPLVGMWHARTAQRARLMAQLHISGLPAETLIIAKDGFVQVKDPRGQVSCAPLPREDELQRLLVQGADIWVDASDLDRAKAVLNGALCVTASEVDELAQHFDVQNLPSEWLGTVVRSIAGHAPYATAERMLIEYATRVYCEMTSAAGVAQAARQL